MTAPHDAFEAEWQAFCGSDAVLPDLLEDLLDNANDGGEPLAALRASGLLRRWLDEQEDELVKKARVEMAPWSQIAGCLGRSTQSVWAKHRDPDELAIDDVIHPRQGCSPRDLDVRIPRPGPRPGCVRPPAHRRFGDDGLVHLAESDATAYLCGLPVGPDDRRLSGSGTIRRPSCRLCYGDPSP